MAGRVFWRRGHGIPSQGGERGFGFAWMFEVDIKDQFQLSEMLIRPIHVIGEVVGRIGGRRPQDILGSQAGPAQPLLVLVRPRTHPRQMRQQLASFFWRMATSAKALEPMTISTATIAVIHEAITARL
jgi:hypothetical protein